MKKQIKRLTEPFKKKKQLPWALISMGVILLFLIRTISCGNLSTQSPDLSKVNLKVPGPSQKDEKGRNKMSFYDQAQVDSIKEHQQHKKDSIASLTGPDSLASKVNTKVAEVSSILKSPPRPPVSYFPTQPPSSHSVDVDRLERIVRSLKDDQGSSPEMLELNKTLDKLSALQRPPIPDSLPFQSPALPVRPSIDGIPLAAWPSGTQAQGRFYDLESSSQSEDQPAATLIEATIPQAQTLIDGGLLRLELMTDLIAGSQPIPKGAPLYGIVHLSGDRMQVKIGSIRLRNQVFPVDLQVVDLDGIAGIYEPGSATRETIRQSTSQGLSSLGPTTLETSLAGQATNTGLQLARSLATRKVRLIRVSVKAGYRVFLQDMTQKH